MNLSNLGLDPKTHRILRQLWLRPLSSRSDIAEKTGLAPSHISRQVAGLIDKGIIVVKEEGEAGPTGGRRPVYLQINPQFGIVLGVEILPSLFRVVGLDLAGETVFRLSGSHKNPYESLPRLFADAVTEGQHESIRLGIPVLGAGLGVPGIVDSDKGVILRSNPLGITEPVNILAETENDFSFPISLEHDVRSCCWGQLLSLRMSGPSDFVFVLGEYRKTKLLKSAFEGVALGMGFVLDNHVYSGSRHAAGEFRSVFYDVPRANAQLSIPDEVLSNLDHDPAVRKLFAEELGRNLTLIVNVLNIPHIYIGGSIESLGDDFLGVLHTEIRKGWQYPDQNLVEIEFAALREDAVAHGAAAMLVYRMLTDS